MRHRPRKGSVASKYTHTVDTALIMAADTIAGYSQGLLDGVAFKQSAYALGPNSRTASLARVLQKAEGDHIEPHVRRRAAAGAAPLLLGLLVAGGWSDLAGHDR